MYEDKGLSTNWVKIGLRIVSVILVILIIFKVVDIVKDNRTNVVEKDRMKEKITLLESAGKNYFKEELLPKKAGDSVTVTLEELIKEELIEEIKDINDETCDLEKTNVKVFRLDSEYQYKSTLVCKDYEDYLNSFVEIKHEDNENNVTIKPSEDDSKNDKVTTTKKTTTKKTTTVPAKKKYTVSFNTNGGTLIKDQTILANDVIVSPGAPTREGFVFVGWYYHGEKFDLNTRINQNYVLVAKWIKD